MKKTVKEDEFLTVAQTLEELKRNGVDWTEVWLRQLIGNKRVKSVKKYSSRLVPRSEVERLVKERSARAFHAG